MATLAGTVKSLWRFPVKSMQGESLDEAELTSGGVLGDRGYALIDVETGKVASAKSAKRFPELIRCKASYIEPPDSGAELPDVRITLPDGTSVASNSDNADDVLSSFFGLEVKLTKTAPADFTIDQYHPDLGEVSAGEAGDSVVEKKVGSAFFAEAEMESPVPEGSFFDLFPITVITTGTLGRLSELQPDSVFDERRFRMNVVIDTIDSGFVENDWIESELQIGATARLNVAMPDPRCVMTTLPQDDLARDNNILRALVKHNRLQVADAGRLPCAGVYAVIGSPGSLLVGDDVSLG